MKMYKFYDLYALTSQSIKPEIKNNKAFEKYWKSNLSEANSLGVTSGAKEAFELLEIERENAKKLLNQILPEIQSQLSHCKKVEKHYMDWADHIISKKSLLFALDGIIENQENALERKMACLCTELMEMEKDALSFYEALQKEISDINEKKTAVETWRWIPFYNMYLNAQYQNANSAFEEKYKRLEEKKKAIRQEMEDLSQAYFQKKNVNDQIKRLVIFLKEEMCEITRKMNQISQIIAHWNEMDSFYTKLDSTLQSTRDIQGALTQANNQLLELMKFEETLNYEEFKVHNIFADTYEIYSQDEKWFVSNREGMVALEKNESPFVACQYTIMTLACGGNMIVNNNYELLTSYSVGDVRFEYMDFKSKGPSPNQKFDILKDPLNQDLFTISNDFVMDKGCIEHQVHRKGYHLIRMEKESDTADQKFFIRKCD